MIKKILKYFIYTLSFIILFALLICFTVWSIIPVYKFPEAVSFTGDNFITLIKIMITHTTIVQTFTGIQGLVAG